jgi:hypothetical protein
MKGKERGGLRHREFRDFREFRDEQPEFRWVPRGTTSRRI